MLATFNVTSANIKDVASLWNTKPFIFIFDSVIWFSKSKLVWFLLLVCNYWFLLEVFFLIYIKKLCVLQTNGFFIKLTFLSLTCENVKKVSLLWHFQHCEGIYFVRFLNIHVPIHIFILLAHGYCVTLDCKYYVNLFFLFLTKFMVWSK